MTETSTLQWIKKYLAPLMPSHPVYTEELLAGLTMREVGIKIMQYAPTLPFDQVFLKFKGDWGKRKGELDEQYHGFGCTQIDIDSYPDFVNSGDWKDPHKTYLKAIEVLEEKRAYLLPRVGALQPEELNKAVIAAYNSGQRNALKDAADGHIDDTYTFNHDYVKEVYRFKKLYTTL